MIQAYKKKTGAAGTVCLVAIIAAVVVVSAVDPNQPGLANVLVPLFSLVAGIAFIALAGSISRRKVAPGGGY
jgi:hypothetical protein